MRTVSSKYVDEVISTAVAPLLKGLGYRKHGRRFVLAGVLSTAHIRFQLSQWNHAERTRFTMSVGRYFESIARKNGEEVVLDSSKQRHMHVGIRIGHLLPQQADHWWSIGNDDDVPKVAAEVVAALRDFGLPYLESVASLDGVAKLAGYTPRTGDHPTPSKASALELLGRNEEADDVRKQLAALAARNTRATNYPASGRSPQSAAGPRLCENVNQTKRSSSKL
ncbi:MAG: hypothetical protein QOI88_886 [Gammaproteobacteria bacterium]|jgi:hypothetical protein|nr:hypothetical protein [Gammaproteobacteria bacterium]